MIGLILAGGRSRRMGRDKAALDWRGRPWLEHMAALLREAGADEVWVSGRPWPGLPHLPDDAEDGGPAAALVSCARRLAQHDRALVVPVDMPLLTRDDLRLLTGADAGARFDHGPLPALAPLAPLRTMPVEPGLSLKRLFDRAGVSVVPTPADTLTRLVNLNTPEEVENASPRKGSVPTPVVRP